MAVSGMVDPRFAAELARSLRDEIGARTLYGRLAGSGRDEEQCRILQTLAEQGRALERKVRGVMSSLESKGRVKSPARWLSARLLDLCARIGLRGFVLRLSVESEEVLARRYAGFAHWLARTGHVHEAQICGELATTKASRALALRPWVPR